MNEQKLKAAIKNFVKKKKANPTYYEEDWAERRERKEFYLLNCCTVKTLSKIAGIIS